MASTPAVSCRACHTSQHIAAARARCSPAKDLNHTWMGLSPELHDLPRGQAPGPLRERTARIATTRPIGRLRPSIRRDVRSLEDALSANRRAPVRAVLRVATRAGADGQPRYAGLPFATCSDCHRDPHKGEFKQGCESCHTTSRGRNRALPTTFDHSKTSFPLLGKHLEVPCVSCHQSADFKAPIPHDGLRRLPQARSAWRSVREARRWRPMRKLPHGAGLEPVNLLGRRSREDRIPADFSARRR